jgi:hypothetical protein
MSSRSTKTPTETFLIRRRTICLRNNSVTKNCVCSKQCSTISQRFWRDIGPIIEIPLKLHATIPETVELNVCSLGPPRRRYSVLPASQTLSEI